MENTPQAPQSAPENVSGNEAPRYGEFGTADAANQPKSGFASASNDGSNDNPDEFSEFRKKRPNSTEDYGQVSKNADPAEQRGHVEQNQNPDAVVAAQDSDEGTRRAAYAADDPRYGSGSSSTWKEDEQA
ncbi:hypothetical protein [Hymenobacter crusticola]|uniref:Uncharacterized protein n=1 Tax=Hymenobacter crusticola TaxID=1770526 RepID=A0A243W7W6_9BACT|nr:hypothetical protein [Hymenobacter crusticola]OUJ71181.1 hypothetical protein BXP70_22110 [Hymenobacter crusticola]